MSGLRAELAASCDCELRPPMAAPPARGAATEGVADRRRFRARDKDGGLAGAAASRSRPRRQWGVQGLG
eukprot:9170263-Alexandrium_andersonii.AAC.1